MATVTSAARRARTARRALDRRFASMPPASAFATPRSGWIRAIRESLGMSLADLASRIGVSHQAVSMLEQSERDGQIRLDSLRRAADAMNCDLVYLLIPRNSLEDTVRAQVDELVRAHTSAVSHSMDLEMQHVDAFDDDAVEEARAQLLGSRRLWKD
jgi:predicted DNA-binding mobile mystery protein A